MQMITLRYFVNPKISCKSSNFCCRCILKSYQSKFKNLKSQSLCVKSFVFDVDVEFELVSALSTPHIHTENYINLTFTTLSNSPSERYRFHASGVAAAAADTHTELITYTSFFFFYTSVNWQMTQVDGTKCEHGRV